MAEVLLSNPFIEVDDEKIAVYGNSAVYDQGAPDINVTSLSAGGGKGQTVHGVDVSTMVGMFKFKLPVTKKSDDLIAKWKLGVATHVVKWYEGDLQKVLLGASYSDGRDMEMNASEGGIEVTFKGDPTN